MNKIFSTGIIFLNIIINAYAQTPSDTSWHKLPSPISASVRAIAETPDHTLYVGTAAGVYKSKDKGKSWEAAGLEGNVIDELCITDKGTLLAGTYRAGIFRSVDGGKDWKPVGLEKNSYVFCIVQDSATIFATASYAADSKTHAGIFKSVDDGKTWKQTALKEEDIITLSNPGHGLLFASGKDKFYRSTDNGASWFPCGKGLPDSIPVSSIISFNKILLASVGNRQDASGQKGGGIFRSENDGLSWKRSDKGLDTSTKVNNLVSFGNIVLASTGYYNGAGNSGVYKSADGGKTWKPSGLQDELVRVVKVTSDNILVAGTVGSALFTSEDKGKHWIQTGKEFDNWETYSAIKKGKYLYVTAIDYAGIWRSSDNGQHWKHIRRNGQELTVLSSGRILTFDKKEILASDNGGKKWKKVGVLDQKGLVFLNNFNDTLLIACTDSGLWYSRNKGTAWISYHIPGYHKAHFRTVTITPKGTILAGYRRGTFDVGILRSDDGGKHWKKIKEGLFVWTLFCDSGIVYAGNYGRGIYKSLDDGITWQPCNKGLIKINSYATITSIARAKDGSIVSTVYGKGVFRTTDQGATWLPYSSGLTNFYNWNIFSDSDGTLYITSAKGIFTRK